MLDTYNEVKAWVLQQIQEQSDGTSDFALGSAPEIDAAMIETWRDLTGRKPWLCLRKDPNGVFIAYAPVLGLTVDAPTVGIGVAATLSATVATSLAGWKMQVAGVADYTLITAHAGGTDALTLDALPVALAAGTQVILFKDEYTLASDLNWFINGLWTVYGEQIELWSEERIRNEYPGPITASSWPARACARIGKNKIRLNSYPPQNYRIEYPYIYEPADPNTTPTDELVIEGGLRTIYALGVMATMFTRKSDARAGDKLRLYEQMILKQWLTDEARYRTLFGTASHERQSDYRV